MSPIDHHVAMRVNQARTNAGLTQEALAKETGVTYQQWHKRLNGHNRVSAAVLWDIAKVTGQPVGWFFEGMADSPPATTGRGEIELMRSFARLSEADRAQVSSLARRLADGDGA